MSYLNKNHSFFAKNLHIMFAIVIGLENNIKNFIYIVLLFIKNKKWKVINLLQVLLLLNFIEL